MPGMRTLDQRAIQSMPTLQDAFAMADNAERPTAITQAVSALVDRLGIHGLPWILWTLICFAAVWRGNEQTLRYIHIWHGGRYRAKVDIRTGEVLEGDLPRAQLACVTAWLILHQREIASAWNKVTSGRKPGKIAPLR